MAPEIQEYLISMLKNLLLLCCTAGLLASCSFLPQQTPHSQSASRPPSPNNASGNPITQTTESAISFSQLTPKQKIIAYSKGLMQTSHTPQTVTLPEYDNLWDKVVSLYQFPQVHNHRIAAEKKWFLQNPDYLTRVSQRARPYLYLIVQQIEQRNMPGELALLPVIESAFQPYAYSHGNAAGIWQVVPQTGRHLGLKQNWWYDGRRDIYAATNAALNYLKQLYQRFDQDWFLALAAYNAGGGNINKAIRRTRRKNSNNNADNQKVSFWQLTLPRETTAYVPRLIALAQILAHRDQYPQISFYTIPNKPYLQRVDCGTHIGLDVAAKLAGISLEELYRYNPGFNQWATDPNGPHYLLLPVKVVKTFQEKLAQTKKSDLIQWQQYRIKQGDTLSRIAKQHGISVVAIQSANHLRGTRIRAGKTLQIPLGNQKNPLQSKEMQKILARIQRHKKLRYRVKKGDSLWTIARKFRVSYQQLARDNHISPRATLSIGQKLTINLNQQYRRHKHTAKNTIRRYRVRQGDSLYTIAKRHKVSIKKLIQWNKLSANRYLQPGQQLVIY